MLSFSKDFVSTSGFMPHGHCFLWTPSLLWTYVIADGVIAAAYYSIPVALLYFVKKRRDLPFSWVFVMFGVFVLACGTTHLFSIWNIWHPDYWADAGLKAITAVASASTAIVIWPLLPKALAIPGTNTLKLANETLELEISRRQQVEGDLRELNRELTARTSELEAAYKDLESFTQTIAHDFRAPLRHIEGYSNLLLENTAHLSIDDVRHLGVLGDSSKKLNETVEHLLAFSKLGRIAIVEKTIDLNVLVEEVRREILDEGTASIDWQIGNLPTVLGDKALLHLVFSNLLDNAIKYSSKKEHPTIQVIGNNSDDEIVVVVKDNGVGFDPRFQHKLFGAFQRLHSDAEFKGTGIGLATVRRIIEKHGGRCWAESAPGKGASFYISFPRRILV